MISVLLIFDNLTDFEFKMCTPGCHEEKNRSLKKFGAIFWESADRGSHPQISRRLIIHSNTFLPSSGGDVYWARLMRPQLLQLLQVRCENVTATDLGHGFLHQRIYSREPAD
jgi:hypothetical protein